jgi:hypothetical protein
MMRSCLLGVGLACALSGLAADPELGYVFPAGGRPGSEFVIEVGGPALQQLVHAVVSGTGVKAALLGPSTTLAYTKRGKPYPAVSPNRYRFKVVVEKDAAPGVRSLRVATAYRLSEPVRFEIGTLAEVSEALTNSAASAQVSVRELPVCLNGRVSGTGADRYRFQATKGATLVAFTEAQVLPRGAFRPALAFTDEAGKPCEGVTAYDGDTAPVLVFEVPQDGAYGLEVTSATGVGGDACVYRVKLGELPLVTGFSPMGAKEGESLNVRLAGCNLQQQRVRLFTGGKNSALCLEALTASSLVLPALRFDLGEESDVEEPDDAAAGAQALVCPRVVNGVLEQPGGRDVFRFSGTSGEVVYVDVRAQALGSPLQPLVTVRNRQGATVARGAFNTNDTAQAAMQGRDPSVRVALAETGEFEVEIADLLGRGSDALRYRLRVGPPQPDFRLWMTPASLNIPADGSALATLYLQRLHGFDGEVRVALDYPPLSIACEGGVFATNATYCKMTVSTDGVRFPHTVFGLSLTGAATLGGRSVKRTAVPLDFYRSSGRIEVQTARELSAKAAASLRALRVELAGKAVLTVPQQAPVRVPLYSPTIAQEVGKLYTPVVVWPPNGFVIDSVQHSNKADYVYMLLKADGAEMRTGSSGRLILGCVRTGDTNKTPVAVTQSVPYVVK